MNRRRKKAVRRPNLHFDFTFYENVKFCEPIGNVAEDDVSQETSNIEEGGGYMGPLSIVAHKVKLCDQCVGILRPAFIRFGSRFRANSSFQVPVIVPAMKTLRDIPSGVRILWPFVAILHQDMSPVFNLGSCSHPYSSS